MRCLGQWQGTWNGLKSTEAPAEERVDVESDAKTYDDHQTDSEQSVSEETDSETIFDE